MPLRLDPATARATARDQAGMASAPGRRTRGPLARALPAWPAAARRAGHAGVWIFLAAHAFAADPPPAPGQSAAPCPATRPAATQPRITSFQRGIRLNWPLRQVEVDFTVILREGLIELFACSPQMREHEAIIRIEARPTHLYQAMGLMGLTPGHPMRMDEKGRVLPASGDAVDVEVRYVVDGAVRQEPIEAWMRPAEGDAHLGRLPWVFAGSIPLEGGRGIATDMEGTVVAVVDFPTSLIALPESHSDRNEELWLRPNTARIPPLGTKGQMIIRAAPLRVRLGADGRLQVAGKTITRAELSRRVARRIAVDPGLCVEIQVPRGADAGEARTLVQMLRDLKVREGSIAVFSESGEKESAPR
jgi:hypothetical protein